MPLHKYKDLEGSYFIWGEHGHKYYFNNKSIKSESIAKEKAMKQARAIEWRKHGGKIEILNKIRIQNNKNKNISDWINYFQNKYQI